MSLDEKYVGSYFQFTKYGNSNYYNSPTTFSFIADTPIDMDMTCACSTGRKVKYKSTNTTFSTINVVIGGWWL